MLKLLLIALGGAIGTLARFWTGSMMLRATAKQLFPWGTLTVNLLGCLLIGYLSGLFSDRLIRPEYRLAITVGFLGGYTTFSSYGWETASFLREREWFLAGAYILANNVVGIALVVIGYGLSRLHT
jgi:fluoride exporter